jgi:hypothetical protein
MDDETRVELFQMGLISANLFGKLNDLRRNDCATTKQLQIYFVIFLLHDGGFKFCLKLSGRYDDAESRSGGTFMHEWTTFAVLPLLQATCHFSLQGR